jgi:hypothetical protein
MSDDFPISVPLILKRHADILTYISRYLGCCYSLINAEINFFGLQESRLKKNMENLSMDIPTKVFPICAMYKGLVFENKIEYIHYKLLRSLQTKSPPKIDRMFIRTHVFLKISERCSDQQILYILSNLDDCYEICDFDNAADIICNYALYDNKELIYLLCTIYTLLCLFSNEEIKYEYLIEFISEKFKLKDINDSEQLNRLKNGLIISLGAIGIYKGYLIDYMKNIGDVDKCDLYSYFTQLFSSR